MTPARSAARHVVERCPSCGVEHDLSVDSLCEACHTPLRPWCSRHGREAGWLDGPACPRCAAEVVHRPASASPSPARRRPEPGKASRRATPPKPAKTGKSGGRARPPKRAKPGKSRKRARPSPVPSPLPPPAPLKPPPPSIKPAPPRPSGDAPRGGVDKEIMRELIIRSLLVLATTVAIWIFAVGPALMDDGQWLWVLGGYLAVVLFCIVLWRR